MQLTALLLVASASAVVALPAAAGTSCTELVGLTIPAITVQSATQVPAGGFTVADPGQGAVLPVGEFCRVEAVARPSADSDIHIEVWIPSLDRWNGKLLGVGNGGFSGAIPYRAMVGALARGYATAGTDTGHTGDQMEFARGHPQKITDWAYRSVHVMTGAAKLIIRDWAGKFPLQSYFQGCSTGGQQALSEGQRFPEDYDGIIAGAPGNNRIRLIVGFLWSWAALHAPDGKPLLQAVHLSRLTREVIASCDSTDGLTDGLIDDPRRCRFDPGVLACEREPGEGCLSHEQIAAVRKVYEGARSPRTGEPLFAGWVRGSEQGWGAYLLDPPEPVRLGLFRVFAFHDPGWDWRTFDWDRDLQYIEAELPELSAVATNLSTFKARGGKLIMYAGWADPVVPPQDVASYYEAVAHTMGGFRRTQEFFRFFPVPGMGHCGGGRGPDTFDALSALEAWVERGEAPERLIASHSMDGARTRPLCVYPRVARYRGKGSIDSADSFSCQ